MNKMIGRVKRLLDQIEGSYTSLDVVETTYGYRVTYFDSFGDRQLITIYVVTGRRTSHIVRWDTNGNLKLRLPA